MIINSKVAAIGNIEKIASLETEKVVENYDIAEGQIRNIDKLNSKCHFPLGFC